MQNFQSSVKSATDGVASLGKEAERAMTALSVIGPWLDRSYEALLLGLFYLGFAFWLHWSLKLSLGQSVLLSVLGERSASRAQGSC